MIHADLHEVIGVRCEVRYVEPLRQPVTFGLRRPVILLPATLAGRNAEIQRAVLSHELFHVKRRDWGWLLAEEIVCAVLWFNPAVWWLVSRLHLAREIVVDELAVLATGRRRAYVEALLAFADETSLAPVAAFGGRRQLFDRLVLLSKEAVMSSHRLVFSCAVMAVVLAAGSWRAMRRLPARRRAATGRPAEHAGAARAARKADHTGEPDPSSGELRGTGVPGGGPGSRRPRRGHADDHARRARAGRRDAPARNDHDLHARPASRFT